MLVRPEIDVFCLFQLITKHAEFHLMHLGEILDIMTVGKIEK